MGISFFDGTDPFKGALAIQTAVFVNRHVNPDPNKMTPILPFYRDLWGWSIWAEDGGRSLNGKRISERKSG
jgi:hypothetical protein